MRDVMRYSGIVTKVAAMRAKLLKPQDYEQLASMDTVTDIIWARKVQPSSVINAWYSSISVSFRSFVKGSAYARNFINMPGARKISSRPVTKP